MNHAQRGVLKFECIQKLIDLIWFDGWCLTTTMQIYVKIIYIYTLKSFAHPLISSNFFFVSSVMSRLCLISSIVSVAIVLPDTIISILYYCYLYLFLFYAVVVDTSGLIITLLLTQHRWQKNWKREKEKIIITNNIKCLDHQYRARSE